MTYSEVVALVQSIALILLCGTIGLSVWVLFRETKTMGAMTENFMTQQLSFADMQTAFREQQRTLADLISWTVPSDEWAEVIELHQTVKERGGEKLDYLVYCAENGGFWATGDHGYTKFAVDAKRFSAYEGLLVVLDRARNGDPHDCFTLVAVGKPEE